VRVIDAFVGAIDLEQLGFVHVKAHKRAASPYQPGPLLNVYMYGYINRVGVGEMAFFHNLRHQ